MHADRLVLGGWIVVAAWTVAIFAAPLTLEPQNVRGLDGHANRYDYGDLWSSLPPFAAIVYALGDLNCHQMESRSWLVNENQMPVDARMTAAFVAATIVMPLSRFVPILPRARDMAAQLVPRVLRGHLDSPGRRTAWLCALWILTFLPAAVDVGAQLVGDYESTNERRALTGIIVGGGMSFLFAVFVRGVLGNGPLGLSAKQGRADAGAHE